ncbi:MAG: exonuclease SbcCD subunit D [Lachnospiraceae bacterium]
MKLLHTSDWHFGILAGSSPMEEDQRFFLKQLYEIIKSEDVDVILCAGDVYDTSVSNAAAIALYNEAATTICRDLGKSFVIIAGNHDGAARLASCRELLEQSGLYVTGRLTRDIKPVVFDQVAIYPIPFFNRDEVIALFPEYKDTIRSQETAAMVVCDYIREEMNRTKRNIIMSHSLIVNAELSESDRSARIGQAAAVSKDVFHDFDYVALGHIHKPQVITEQIRYCGSPVKFSFGKEESQEKGVVIIDTKTMEQKVVALKQLHDRKTIETNFDELITRTDLVDDYLRIQLNDRYAGLELLSELRERFPYLLELYGKSLEENGEMSAMTVKELEFLDETEIMKRFFAETFQYEPTALQVSLFEEVLQAVEKAGEFS